MFTLGIIGCIGLVVTDWIINHQEAIKFYVKDFFNFYYNYNKELFNR